ncbi:hypothetical protein DFH06DRAFT_1132067 [Mycena polygramma]|nr:hypothetical protein DFH06DRAFT_1132067 [Mycena polygramma]
MDLAIARRGLSARAAYGARGGGIRHQRCALKIEDLSAQGTVIRRQAKKIQASRESIRSVESPSRDRQELAGYEGQCKSQARGRGWRPFKADSTTARRSRTPASLVLQCETVEQVTVLTRLQNKAVPSNDPCWKATTRKTTWWTDEANRLRQEVAGDPSAQPRPSSGIPPPPSRIPDCTSTEAFTALHGARSWVGGRGRDFWTLAKSLG